MAVGENIQKYRNLKELTKENLALKARIGVQTLESYENNERIPELDTLLKISTVLDIPASELMEDEEERVIDDELHQLVQQVGVKRTKLLLRKALDFSEDEVLKAMNLLYDLKNEKNEKNRFKDL
ncbi:helix-turn-helix domain-containing protein [Halobacillus sp. A5]|uniref:helix-turn-helix domain-containing protein n=1 Tax=Halobacillus sp. A5 TaxID=2880263 RepID=UPI0020A67E06|nr:helix-turn-helix transcriptional regulator [Halobacillus sp. A5]MCP3028285.1 helix-turn-helix transcriptional regulator [Halobacillus sp. A5]